MKAVVISRIDGVEKHPLQVMDLPDLRPAPGQLLIQVLCCGVCHTELDEIEGRLKPPGLPIVPGHQVVGKVIEIDSDVHRHRIGDRVGVTWLYDSCSKCKYCTSGRENLCADARWTGLDVHGGYAEYLVVDQNYAYPIPDQFSDMVAAPLLCAGVIGYRTIRLASVQDNDTIGLFGFGASAHIVIQIVKFKHPNCKVFVFTRSHAHRKHAIQLGADWAGKPSDLPPCPLDVAMDFTPVGESVNHALAVSAPGARIVINAIRKISPVGPLDYTSQLWHERSIQSVANVTRADAEEFLPLAAQIPIRPKVTEFALEQANDVLIDLKAGKIDGAAVLRIAK